MFCSRLLRKNIKHVKWWEETSSGDQIKNSVWHSWKFNKWRKLECKASECRDKDNKNEENGWNYELLRQLFLSTAFHSL